MENASKALVIAGAILLVIAIIAIAVGIVSKTRGTMNTAENQINSMAVQIHNKQFEKYKGIITGEEVKECIATVLSNNSTTKNREMLVKINLRYTKPGETNSTFHIGKYYDVGNNKIVAYSHFIQEFTTSHAEKIDNTSLFKVSEIKINKYGLVYWIFIDRI